MENFASAAGNLEHSSGDQVDILYDNTIFPSLVARVKAVFVDFIFLLMIFAGTSVSINAIGGVSDFVKGSIAVFFLCLYDPILTSFTGGTLGHKLMGIGVRKNNDPGKYISFAHALLRFLTKGFLGWLSFLTVTTNKRKRAIHDIASGSIVITIR